MSIKGKCAIVTGSTKGIGLAIAKALSREGVNVVISSRHSKDVDRVVKRLSAVGSARIAGLACDVGDPLQVARLIDFCEDSLGSLDILVNNAGVGIFKTVEELSAEDWNSTLATNLSGLFYACHHAIPLMKRQGGGFIVNIGSLAGANAFPGGAAYNASKFGLVGFSEALMQEVRHDDIRVCYIMPGSVDTSFGTHSPGKATSWKIAPADVAEVVIQTLTRHPRCLTSRIEMRPSKPPRK